jgi:hypothetical protein
MLGDSEIAILDNISNQYGGFKTLLSGAKNKGFSQFSQTPDINSASDSATSIFNPSSISNSMNVNQIMNRIVGGFASTFNKTKSFQFKINNSKINDKGPRGGLLKQLLALIMGIVELPKRFTYLSKSLMGATAALALGATGVYQSLALGIKDIYLLLLAIGNIIVKYILCILSFIITTIAGCFLVHPITLFFAILYVFSIYLAGLLGDATGIDIKYLIDDMADNIQWPAVINTVCYSCFGKRVKLRDILTDVKVIEDAGNRIAHDFNITMPRYMKRAKPPAKGALKDLDKAIN